METQNTDTITIKKDTLWKYSTFVLLGVVILGAIFFVLPGKSPTGNVIQQPGQGLPDTPPAKVEVDLGDAPILGDANAPVTLVEFTDYECPFCARHFTQTGPALKELVDDGALKIATMDYPLPFHTQAQKAAEAAHCARDQGGDSKYYEMHDLLFESGVSGGETAFKEYATQLGLDATKFATCLSSGKFAQKVKDNLEYGSQIGIQGTPGFFIFAEGEKAGTISGACPAQTFISAINAEKDGKEWVVSNCQIALA